MMRRLSVDELPEPECESGYTQSQVAKIMGDDLPKFRKWMHGQTEALCEGRKFNPKTRTYDVACGGLIHGRVTYLWDVRRFLEGKPIIDW